MVKSNYELIIWVDFLVQNKERRMSVQSINSYSPPPYFDSYKVFEDRLRQSIDELDMNSIKDLVSKGANPNQKLTLDFDKSNEVYLLTNDNDVFAKTALKFLVESVDTGCFTEGQREIISKIIDYLSEGNTFSTQFYKSFVPVFKETLPFYLTEETLEIFKTWKTELSLFAFAVEIRDLDLIRVLVESGVDIKYNESKSGSFFEPGYFTQRNIEMIDYMLSQSYPLESLLVQGETFEGIVTEAKEGKDELLLSFLAERGISSKENVEIADLDHKA